MAEKLLSVHIEKAGGTSLEDFYKNLYGPERVLIYNPRLDTITRSSSIKVPRSHPFVSEVNKRFGNHEAYLAVQKIYSQLVHQWSQHEEIKVGELAQEDFTVLHGHFTADQFDKYLESPLMAIVFREPLDRMLSQFNHWKRLKGNVDWRTRIPFDENLTFEDYALLTQLQNYQTQALGGKPLEQFSAVGTTDNLDRFVQALMVLSVSRKLCNSKMQYGDQHVKRLNESPQNAHDQKIEFNPRFRIKFEEFHQEDYELYNRAIQK